jgi:hypothetical protein
MKNRLIRTASFVLLLLVPVLACNIITTGSVPTPIEDVIPFPVTVPPTSTLDPNAPPRWIEYERALASVLLGPVGNTVPDLSRDHGLCEWIFMGQKGEQVYAWAECQNDEGTATSAPAVIFLGEDGHIKAVVMPDEGWGNLKELFPAPVVELIFSNSFDAKAAMEHIHLRRADPSIPPLIVEQGGIMP